MSIMQDKNVCMTYEKETLMGNFMGVFYQEDISGSDIPYDFINKSLTIYRGDRMAESGGTFDPFLNTGQGQAVIICGNDYEKLPAVFVPEKGVKPCGKHAWVKVEFGTRIFLIVSITIRSHDITPNDFSKSYFSYAEYVISYDGRFERRRYHNKLGMTEYLTGNFNKFYTDDEKVGRILQVGILKSQDYLCKRPYYVTKESEGMDIFTRLPVDIASKSVLNHDPIDFTKVPRGIRYSILQKPIS